MFSLKERLTLQKSVKTGIEKLKAGIANLRDRLQVQKETKTALAQLQGEQAPQKSLFEQLLDGRFDGYKPPRFWNTIEAVLQEIKGDYAQLIEPIIKYMRLHENESVMAYDNA